MTAIQSTPVLPKRVSTIVFEKNMNGVKYGYISVPMNYQELGGARVRVAFSVRPATGGAPGARLGALLVINGGPGGDNSLGIRMPDKVAAASDLGYHYDIIGMDFRGRGDSSKLTTRSLPSAASAVTRPTDAQFEQVAEQMSQRESLCAEYGGELRDHVTTMNVVRDIEALRMALDEPQFSFVGMAYGSLVAAVYSTLYPDSTGRVVLDSVINPTENWQERFSQQVRSIDINVQDWANWCASHDEEFKLGKTSDAVVRSIEVVAASTMLLPAGPQLVSVLDAMVGKMTSEERSWPALVAFLQRLLRSAQHDDTSELVRMLSQTTSWRPSDVDAREQEAVLEAITSETPWTSDMEEYFIAMKTVRDTCPYGFAVMRVQPWVGTFRQSVPTERIPTLSWSGDERPLIVQSQRDTLSREANGKVMADLLNGRLVRLVGTGVHEAFMFAGIHHLDDVVVTYLTSGECPPLVVIDCRDSVGASDGR